MKKIITLLLFVSAFGCSNDSDPEADKSFFTKFYDNSGYSVAYTPFDAVQTSDGGYLVLGLKRTVYATGDLVDYGSIYIMKTDALGNFISDKVIDEEDLTIPAPQFLTVAGKFYFFCMEKSTYSTQLIQVNDRGGIEQQLNIGGSYPIAAGVDGSNLLLLNYDNGTKQTRMSVVGTDGHIQKSKAFTIGAGDGPEEPIMASILRTGRHLPFQVGTASNGLYFFNGFYNYTLSTVFTDLSADNPQGVIQGNQEDGGASQIFPLSSGKFAVARFNYGDNYLLPQGAVQTSGTSSWATLGGLSFPELSSNTPVTIISTPVRDTDRIIYGGNTRGKQIGLFGYNPVDGTLVGKKYIGFSNSFELASLTPTSDKGLLVLGTTYIAGRLPRICLFKLSAASLGESFQ